MVNGSGSCENNFWSSGTTRLGLLVLLLPYVVLKKYFIALKTKLFSDLMSEY